MIYNYFRFLFVCVVWCGGVVWGEKKKFSLSAFSHPMLDYQGRYPLFIQYDWAGEATTIKLINLNISEMLNDIFAEFLKVDCVGYPHVVGKTKKNSECITRTLLR